MNQPCSHCGTDNAAESRFCRNCGRQTGNGPAPTPVGSDAQATLRWTGGPLQARPELYRATSLEQLFSGKRKVLIGRAPECELCLAHPTVSRHHAELELTESGALRLTDSGSMNGTTIEGQRLSGAALLRDRQQVGIGPFLFSLDGQVLRTIDSSRGLRLEARALQMSVRLGDGSMRKLLDNISLAIEPGEFVCLLGPSGSGKSTLMDCLNGRRRATGGRVLANSQDFYGHFDNFRQSLGYVPQKDIVHTQLSVARALHYTAQLRLPVDTSPGELKARKEEVIRLMELGPHRDTLVGNLSGGQVKRVSLGAELLARPSFLYIDEATSGLDAGTEARMMKLFRTLADEGKSLLCITHNVENVDHCHSIIVLARGKLVYYGPPAEARRWFGVSRISEIYDRLPEREVEKWEMDFAASPIYGEFVAKRLGMDQPPSAGGPASLAVAEAARPRQNPAHQGFADSAPATPFAAWLQRLRGASSKTPRKDEHGADLSSQSLQVPAPRPGRSRITPWWHQLRVLTLRYIELLWSDRRSLKLLFLQAPLVALFLLAGFVGKPYQAKIPVPHVSDDEYLVLQTVQALDRDFEAAGTAAEGRAGSSLDKLEFRMSDLKANAASLPIPYRDLMRRLKELRDVPGTRERLERFQIAIEQRDPSGETRQVTRSAAALLDLQRDLHHSDVIGQLMEAHEIAGTVSPRYTYVLLFLISIIVLWFGCNNAAKEIVKEEAIYGRERAVNLGIVPYLSSKFIVLTAITVAQAAMLMLLVYGTMYLVHVVRPEFIERYDMPAQQYMLPYGEQFLVLTILSMAGVALGLLLSACVSSPDRANALLPYVLIPQIILGGGIMPIRHGLLEWLAWTLSPEYWAFRAIRQGTHGLPDVLAEGRTDYQDSLWLPGAALLVQAAIMLVLTAWFLRRKDVSRG
jgi:ABC-type multidrug transport system ATPase subunit